MPTSTTRPAVVVTGAASGIGLATTHTLAAAGYHVFAGMHTDAEVDAFNALATAGVTALQLDVTDPANLTRAAQLVAAHVGAAGLAGLVNNAGIGNAAPLELLDPHTLRRLLEVNVIGQLQTTQAMLPLLRSGSGRIINIGSVGGRITMPFAGALCATKHAVTALNDALRMELSPWRLPVCLIEPASIRTPAVDQLEHNAQHLLADLTPINRQRYARSFSAAVTAAVTHEKNGSPAEEVGATVLRALTARRPKSRYPTGSNAHLLLALTHLPDRWLDRLRLRLLTGRRPHFSRTAPTTTADTPAAPVTP